jgi:hypothetical protein
VILKQSEVVTFRLVWVSIPSSKLQSLFYSKCDVCHEDKIKLLRKLREIEEAQEQLSHARSVVEKILLRC